MIDFILLLIIGSLWIWGFRTPFQEGYLLQKLGDIFRDEDDNSPPNMIGTWMSKPIFDCPPCMSLFHGCIIFFIIAPFLFHFALPLRQLIPYIICLCGVNYLIKTILYPDYE
jgi:hypothetical protein